MDKDTLKVWNNYWEQKLIDEKKRIREETMFNASCAAALMAVEVGLFFWFMQIMGKC